MAIDLDRGQRSAQQQHRPHRLEQLFQRGQDNVEPLRAEPVERIARAVRDLPVADAVECRRTVGFPCAAAMSVSASSLATAFLLLALIAAVETSPATE
ncbi:MAG: hypothetical protein ACRD29_21205 [Acidimicrobiales bacterium]